MSWSKTFIVPAGDEAVRAAVIEYEFGELAASQQQYGSPGYQALLQMRPLVTTAVAVFPATTAAVVHTSGHLGGDYGGSFILEVKAADVGRMPNDV